MSHQDSGASTASAVTAVIAEVIDKHDDDLRDLRRDLHAHPELSWSELHTAEKVSGRIEQAGWRVTRYSRTGFIADIGENGPRVALRADMDALPIQDLTDDPWSSKVSGVAHACGHDVHTTALTGAALALAEVHRAGLLPGRIRLLFQPAEEVMPGGALYLIEHGALEEVDRIFALHCDPGVDVGQAALRLGPLTSAADRVEVRLTGSGGHTSRPHLTGDITFALAKVTTELPGVLSRRMDPRAGVSVVWGSIHAGAAANVIPDHGILAGTVRILDPVAWEQCETVVREVIDDIVRPYGVTATIDYQRGVPPVVNEPVSHRVFAEAIWSVLGESGQVQAPQSLGGEDFGWYLNRVPGAMVRLGTRTPGGPTYDLHQGNLRIDERAVGIGAKLLAAAAAGALRH